MDVLVLLCSKALGFVRSKPRFSYFKKKKKKEISLSLCQHRTSFFFFFSFVHDKKKKKKKSILFLSQNIDTKLQTIKRIKIKQDN